MKATALAPSNIAFIKFWGKKDEALRLPYNDSISMNLSEAYTKTTVEFSSQLSQDEIFFISNQSHRPYKLTLSREYIGFGQKEVDRMLSHLDRLRNIVGKKIFAKVYTQNTFPKSSGIASSASGFAALTLAGAAALNLSLSEKELSILARFGSGSAARSIPDGFVEWKEGKTSEDSFAYSLYPHTYWDLADVLAIVSSQEKNISTTQGHEAVTTSPFFRVRLESLPVRIKKVKEGLKKKDLSILGPAIEEEAINTHAVMMTQNPPLFYWTGVTMEIIRSIKSWREEGLPVYFTIDAGPNVHLICEAQDAVKISEKVKKIKGVEKIIINKPAQGAHLI